MGKGSGGGKGGSGSGCKGGGGGGNGSSGGGKGSSGGNPNWPSGTGNCWRDAETWTFVNFWNQDGSPNRSDVYSRCRRCGPPTFIGSWLLHDSRDITFEEAKVWEVMKL